MLIWLLSAALANDAVFGGAASALVPLQETAVQMVSEDITLEGSGHAHAVYRFHNPTKAEVKLQVGFPEEQCDPDEEMECNAGFVGLVTLVRGVPVKTRIGAVGERPSWAPETGRVHLFELTFAPDETVEVVHDYDFGLGASAMGDVWLTYLTRTGSSWAGPIGRARFTVWLDGPVVLFDYPSSYHLVSSAEVPALGRSRQVVVFEQVDWTPTQDFAFYWQRGGEPYEDVRREGPCKLLSELDFDWSDELVVRKIPKPELRVCRNEIYARHGYTFSDPMLSELFYEVNGRQTQGDKVRVRFIGNPLYDDALLTEKERWLVERMRAAEGR